MNLLICHQMTLLTKSLITSMTAKWLLTSVYPLMPHQKGLFRKCLITHITAKWPHFPVCMLMPYQFTLLTKSLITYITREWPLSPKYLCMYHQISLSNKPLFTHTTAKWPLSTAYLLVCYKSTLFNKWQQELCAHNSVSPLSEMNSGMLQDEYNLICKKVAYWTTVNCQFLDSWPIFLQELTQSVDTRCKME